MKKSEIIQAYFGRGGNMNEIQLLGLINQVGNFPAVAGATVVWNSIIVYSKPDKVLSPADRQAIKVLAKQYNLSVCYQ